MRIKLTALTMILLLAFISGCGMPGRKKEPIPKIDLIIKNPLSTKRTDAYVELKVSDLKKFAPDFYQKTFIILDNEANKEIPYQLDDMDNDGEGDEIAMVVDMEPMGQKKIMIRYSPETPESRPVTLGHTRRTRAAIHPEYQGIGWESELVGYRLYPDSRNSISVLGKQSPGLSLDTYALRMADAKTKITKVLDGGDSIGCGGFGIWDGKEPMKPKDCRTYTRIIADGPIRSVAQVIFDGWSVGDQTLRITSTYFIYAGQRWSKANIMVKGADHSIKIACGLTKSKLAELTKNDSEGFFYTYGKQSRLNPPDNLGLALIYPNDRFDSFHGDGNAGSYLVALNCPADSGLSYWFMSAWERGELGAKDSSSFAEMVSSAAGNIKEPLTVTIITPKPNESGVVQQEKGSGS